MLFFVEGDMLRLIGYSLFCIAIGLFLALFINSNVIQVLLIAALLFAGYELFACDHKK
jgi:4-hydroxybenzoate polyprenyltransferase